MNKLAKTGKYFSQDALKKLHYHISERH